MADNELIQRAIAKQKGLPYPDVRQAVDDALESFDAAKAPPQQVVRTIEPRPLIRTVEPPSADNNYNAVEPGNIDLTNRPQVTNPDGSVSTVRSMGVNVDGKEYLIPTVSNDGRVMSDDEAVDEFKRTGQHLGVYASPEASNRAAEAIHNDQAALLDQGRYQLPPDTGNDLGSLSNDIDAITRSQADSALRMGDAQSKSAKRKGDLYDQRLKESDEFIKSSDAEIGTAKADTQKKLQELTELNARVRELPPIHDSRNAGQRVWGALALIGSGFSEGLSASGGENNNAVAETSKLINDGIQRDIDLQQKEYDNRRKNAAAKENEYALSRQFLSDTMDARKFAFGLRKERFADAIEGESAKLDSQVAREKALQAAGQYRLEGKKEQLDVLKKLMGPKISPEMAMMMVKMGILSPADAKALLGAGVGDGAGAPPTTTTKGRNEYRADERADRDRLTYIEGKLNDRGAIGAYSPTTMQTLQDFSSGKRPLPQDYTLTGKLYNSAGEMIGKDTRSQDLIDLESAMAQAVDLSLRLATGANAPPSEVATEYRKHKLSGSLQSPEALKKGLKDLHQYINDRLNSIRAVDPEAYDEYMRRTYTPGHTPQPLRQTQVTGRHSSAPSTAAPKAPVPKTTTKLPPPRKL